MRTQRKSESESHDLLSSNIVVLVSQNKDCSKQGLPYDILVHSAFI